MSGGVESTLHLPVPEIQLLGVTQEEWNEDEEIPEEEEEEGEGRNKVRLVRSHAIRDSVSPPPPERKEEAGSSFRGEASDQRSVVSSDGGEIGTLEGGVASGENRHKTLKMIGENWSEKKHNCQAQTVGGGILTHQKVKIMPL